MAERYDAIVVGAGLAGTVTALALSAKGFSVLLCDRKRSRLGDDDPRTTALAYASVRALKRLGVWTALEEHAAPVRRIAVSNARPPNLFGGGGRGPSLAFDDGLLGDTERWAGTPLAWIAPNPALGAALAAAADSAPGIARRDGIVAGFEAGAGGAEVRFEDGHTAASSLVIACDGRRSPLRRRAGLRTIERDLRQDALTFTIGHTRPHEGTARQLFLPGGPLAALPLPGDRSSVVWSMPRRQADALMAAPDALAGMVEERLGELGAAERLSKPARFPLGLLYAPRLTAPRLALVGEAGHVIHPIAGQGYNLAVADACALADVLVEARDVGLDPGHGTVLSRYDAWRRADTALMAFGTSGLARVLSTPERITRGVTGLGFGLVSRSEGLQRAFVRRAGGEAGPVPSLMAGDA